MKTIFCTYCCRTKDPVDGLIPTLERYKSKRIRSVHKAAQHLGFATYILSGKYGLLISEHPIPYYDYLLSSENVDTLTQTVEQQLLENSISSVIFYAESSNIDPDNQPYINVITKACKNKKIDFSLVILPNS
ncbi:hypothetical protein KAJ27_17545 [bacterium]|nr:hypothetical protein [bacterium]